VLATRWAQGSPADPLVGAAVTWLARHPAERVHRLAPQLGVSSRHLQRRFVAAVGYGPKSFQRIVRFQRLLALGKRQPEGRLGLTGLALAAGYADQAP
jgi:transcriptional regulator GlxA family with amidase domain